MTFARSSALSFSGLLVMALACSAGCGGSTSGADSGNAADTESDVTGTTYGNLIETLSGPDVDRWVAVRTSLATGFDQICGDTICGGDYSNLTTVRIACSSTVKTKKLKACTWVLGGNIDYVDGRTGKLTSDARMWTCAIPVSGTATTMLDTLTAAGDKALQTPLATGKSFYDALVDCFAGTIGMVPPTSDKAFYSELDDYLNATNGDAASTWERTVATLEQNFDDACGDSFCEGDFSDISGLRFSCAVNANTQRVARCTWTFAAADLSVDPRGTIVANTTNKRCYVDVNALQTDFRAALAVPDALHAKLPGKTTSIYDALIGCL